MSRTLSRRGGAAAAGLALALGLAGPASAAPTTTYVLPADLGAPTPTATQPCPTTPAKWCTQTRGTGTIGIASSVAPKAGPASLLISTPDGNAKAYALNTTLATQPLSALTTLAYESYVITPGTDPANGANLAPAVNVEVDTNGVAAGGYAVLVWEPLYAAQNCGGVPVAVGVWQAWAPSATCGWWSPANRDPGNPAMQASPGVVGTLGFAQYTATFAEVKAALPAAVLTKVGVNQGGGNQGLSSNVDLLRVNDTTYDFELVAPAPDLDGDGVADTAPPTNANQCRDNGYKSFNNPTFRNQGECVSYVNKR